MRYIAAVLKRRGACIHSAVIARMNVPVRFISLLRDWAAKYRTRDNPVTNSVPQGGPNRPDLSVASAFVDHISLLLRYYGAGKTEAQLMSTVVPLPVGPAPTV